MARAALNPRPGLRRALSQLRHHRRGTIGLALLAIIVFVGLLAPLLAPHDPFKQNLLERLQPPSGAHWLGTDSLGHDILSRIIYGARYSLGIGVAAVLMGLIIGTALGLIAGYWGGWLDLLVMRLIDVLMAFPGILLALVFVTILGPGFFNVVVAIGVFSVPQYCRIVRAETMSLREREFIHATRALGSTHAAIILRHVLPNSLAPILVLSSLRLAAAILTAAALGFLGLGIPPHVPEWGAILNQGRSYLRVAPHLAISPGIAIAVTTLSINLVGDMLRDILDPRLRA